MTTSTETHDTATQPPSYVHGREAAAVQITVWQGEITVYWPAADGASYVAYYRCTHHHADRPAALRCEGRMRRTAARLPVDAIATVDWMVSR
jgi:hypothetical protein